jgi:putative ABC transport system permease protein
VLTPYRLAHGRAPAGPGEIVLDAGLASEGGLRVGDRVRIVDPGGAQTFSLVGVATASRAQQQRQSSVFMTQARAQQVAGLGSGVNAIAVRAEPGTTPAPRRDRLAEAVGGPAQVLDHRHAAAADAGDPRALDRTQLSRCLPRAAA